MGPNARKTVRSAHSQALDAWRRKVMPKSELLTMYQELCLILQSFMATSIFLPWPPPPARAHEAVLFWLLKQTSPKLSPLRLNRPFLFVLDAPCHKIATKAEVVTDQAGIPRTDSEAGGVGRSGSDARAASPRQPHLRLSSRVTRGRGTAACKNQCAGYYTHPA